MRLKNQILSVLNTNGDFLLRFTSICKESKKNTDAAFYEIVNTVVYSLHIQYILNSRTEEVCRIAKECAKIDFNTNGLLYNQNITMKGAGVNSELIGDRFGGIVEIIAELSGLKSRSANKLFTVITPAVLSSLFFNYKVNNFTPKQIALYIEKLAKTNQPALAIQAELNGLIKNDEIKQVVNFYYPQHHSFFSRFIQNITGK